jgi:hypothetical protein
MDMSDAWNAKGWRLALAALAAGFAACPPSARAQTAQMSAADIAKLTQNPLADASALPISNDTNFAQGPYRQPGNVLQFQPVIPFSLNSDWNLVTRTTIPVMQQVRFSDTEGPRFGLGDIVPIFALSPAHTQSLIWGLGPSFTLPTATSRTLGTRKWSAGPTAIALIMPDPWVFGLLVTQMWSFAGAQDAQRVNRLATQYFVNYNLSDGWYLTSSPIITTDWTAQGGKWTIPFGGGLGRVFEIGSQPMSASLGAYYNAIRPNDGSTWQLSFSLSFVFAK